MWLPQVADRQPVEVDQGPHPPFPLHMPSLEQSPVPGLLAAHRCFGSGWPSGTCEQVPTLPLTLQLMHRLPVVASAQAELQQTPSVQNPLEHCAAVVQDVPLAFLPQELPEQVFGDVQSVSLLQVLRQLLALQM
jgi:hypothetical protein